MSTDARALRQFAELIRAGNNVEIPFEKFGTQTAKDLSWLLGITKAAGGPIAPTLDRLATVILKRDQSSRELELAVAGPKASSRLVLSLPVLVFIGAGISGIPIFKVLTNQPVVWGSLVLGGLMFWLGHRWTSVLLAKAEPETSDPGLNLDALAIASQAGLPLPAAADLVGGIDVSELQEMSLNSSIAMVQLLIDRADSLRQEQHNRDRLKIQKTSVAVLWPLGITVLPAFVLIAIVPVAAALLQNQ